MTTALSVWTHLGEDDAVFYFNEISRVLKPNGKAIVTFFLLDETYRNSLETRSDQAGRFHQTSQDLWIFDQPSYGSDMWFHPEWAKIPENAIGVNEAGLERLVKNSGLKLIEHHQGNWKEVPGVFFQDVLIFQKTWQFAVSYSKPAANPCRSIFAPMILAPGRDLYSPDGCCRDGLCGNCYFTLH